MSGGNIRGGGRGSLLKIHGSPFPLRETPKANIFLVLSVWKVCLLIQDYQGGLDTPSAAESFGMSAGPQRSLDPPVPFKRLHSCIYCLQLNTIPYHNIHSPNGRDPKRPLNAYSAPKSTANTIAIPLHKMWNSIPGTHNLLLSLLLGPTCLVGSSETLDSKLFFLFSHLPLQAVTEGHSLCLMGTMIISSSS